MRSGLGPSNFIQLHSTQVHSTQLSSIQLNPSQLEPAQSCPAPFSPTRSSPTRLNLTRLNLSLHPTLISSIHSNLTIFNCFVKLSAGASAAFPLQHLSYLYSPYIRTEPAERSLDAMCSLAFISPRTQNEPLTPKDRNPHLYEHHLC